MSNSERASGEAAPRRVRNRTPSRTQPEDPVKTLARHTSLALRFNQAELDAMDAMAEAVGATSRSHLIRLALEAFRAANHVPLDREAMLAAAARQLAAALELPACPAPAETPAAGGRGARGGR